MFDDPNKALKDLQDRLLAAEMPEEDIFAPQAMEPEELTESELFSEEEELAPPAQGNRRIRTALLLTLLLLEVAALFGVLAWWLLW